MSANFGSYLAWKWPKLPNISQVLGISQYWVYCESPNLICYCWYVLVFDHFYILELYIYWWITKLWPRNKLSLRISWDCCSEWMPIGNLMAHRHSWFSVCMPPGPQGKNYNKQEDVTNILLVKFPSILYSWTILPLIILTRIFSSNGQCKGNLHW